MAIDVIEILLETKKDLANSDGFHSPMIWRKALKEIGIGGLDLPTRVGGNGLSTHAMAEIFATCGSISLDLRDVPGAGHARLLTASKSGRFDSFLRKVVSGDAFCAIAITEETGGSDLHNLCSVAIPDGMGYRLTGSKKYISRLGDASHVILFAHVQRGSEKAFSAFLLPTDFPGLTITNLRGMGLQGTSWGEINFSELFIHNEMRIGGEGEGFSLFSHHFTYWRTLMAAAAIGCARGAMNFAIQYLKDRNAFGGPIGRFTHLQQQLAFHASQLHMAWLLIEKASARIDTGQVAFVDAALAKAEAVEIALAAVQWCLFIQGAQGYSKDSDIEKRMRDLLGLRVADGTTDVLRGQVARSILGNEIYELSLGRNLNSKLDSPLHERRFW